MRTSLVALMLLSVVTVLALGCVKQPPPAEPTAQEYFDSGMRFYQQENFAYAQSEFERAVYKSPSFVEAQYYLGLASWKLNMIEKAKKAFVDTLNLNPNYLPARESLGILLYNLSEFPEAKRNLEAARSLNSINPDVYLALGKIYVMEGRCPEALDVFQRGVTVDSSSLRLKTELDNAKRTCGKPQVGAPKVIHEKRFRGGGKALDPSNF